MGIVGKKKSQGGKVQHGCALQRWIQPVVTQQATYELSMLQVLSAQAALEGPNCAVGAVYGTTGAPEMGTGISFIAPPIHFSSCMEASYRDLHISALQSLHMVSIIPPLDSSC